VPVYYPEMFRHIGVGVLNGSLWTIPVECSFYLVVPLFCLARRRRGIAFTAGVLLVLSLVGQSVVWAFGPNAAATKILNITFLPHLVFFALGIGWSWGWSRAPRHAALGVACLLLYVGFRYELVAPREWLGPLWTFAWGVPLSYTVLWVGYRGPAILRTLTRIGDLSYGVYIWHMVIVNVLLFVGIKTWGWSDPAILGTVVAATLTLALVSWWALERPCLQLKPFTSRDSVSTVAPASEDVRLAPRVVGPVAVDS
jgi:peptidoglycan/LPS O-acetylase OafA/YrhL